MTKKLGLGKEVAASPVGGDAETALVQDMAELAGMARRRAAAYALLARIFRVEVDQDFLKELRGTRFPAKTGNDDIDEGYRLIASYLSHAKGDALTELAVDYVRAFIGGGFDGHAAAYPYESVYTSEKRLLMQEARDEVLAIYRANGLDKAPEWAEAEDHVALELEFERLLCERAAEAFDAGDEEDATRLLETQRGFAQAHLAAWVPAFVHDVLHFAKSDFYLGAARLLRGFVHEDVAFLDELLAADAA